MKHPSGEKAKLLTESTKQSSPRREVSSTPESVSQTEITPKEEPPAMTLPSGDHAALSMLPIRISRREIARPVVASKSCMVGSSLVQIIMRDPSGENDNHLSSTGS